MNRKNKILFAVGPRELEGTSQRLLCLISKLANYGFHLDVMSYDAKACEQLKTHFAAQKNVECVHLSHEERFWTMAQRDGFAKTFIKLFHDRRIPGTDHYFYKMSGFDDYLWNVSSIIFPKIQKKYDLIVIPVPSSQEAPPAQCDMFYTALAFHGKQNQIPLMGLQIYPITAIPPIYIHIMDYWVVNEILTQTFLIDQKVSQDQIYYLNDLKDNYCISMIEDPYKNHMFGEDYKITKDKLAIIVVNHSRYRRHILEIIEVISSLKIPKILFFTFQGFTVKELHEKDIFEDLIKPEIVKRIGNFYGIEPGHLPPVMMQCDILLSASYFLPLSFMARYGKLGVVYDPLAPANPYMNEVKFVQNKDSLKEVLMEFYHNKQKIQGIQDIVQEVLK